MASVKNAKTLNPKHLALNIVIALLGIVVFFLLYSFITNSFVNTPVEWTTEGRDNGSTGAEIIQLDVLNGCGVTGIAQTFTDFLRKRNFDVVQSSNYKTFDVQESIVIDRLGDLQAARRVAYALGIDEKNVVQLINTDYYLNVSVVIGHDYKILKPFQ